METGQRYFSIILDRAKEHCFYRSCQSCEFYKEENKNNHPMLQCKLSEALCLALWGDTKDKKLIILDRNTLKF